MPAATLQPTLFDRAIHRRARGWIGVDVGTRTLKLAKVDRVGSGWRLRASWLVPTGGEQPLHRQDVLGGLVRDRLLAAKPIGFHGRPAASLLPMSLMDLRTLELPAGSDDELRQMIGQELVEATGGREQIEFDHWDSGGSASRPDGLTSLAVLSVRQSLAAALAENLLGAGLRCQALDGLPFALARAAAMATTGPARRCAALDWGAASVTFTVVEEGRPGYVRLLRECGFSGVIGAVSQGMNVTPAEAQQLLTTYGICPNGRHGSHLQQVLSELVSEPLEQCLEELGRTWAFLQAQEDDEPVEVLWLFGGGATVRNIAAVIADRLGIDARIWQLPRDDDAAAVFDPVQPLFGPAIALSALAARI